MINLGKFPVLNVNVAAVDYDYATRAILDAARRGQPFSVSALAVHGVMTGFGDPEHARRLNGLDLVVPDGQPVRWALGWLHGKRLPDRVYGPELTLRVARALAEEGLSVYLYGSQPQVLERFAADLRRRFPGLKIAGMEASKFRRTTPEEQQAIARRIRESGADVVFVGLGCPRQEVWAFEYRELLSRPILAVGAAFDFHAGTLAQAPRAMQNLGLEWLFRLVQEPRRLWRRYVLLNPLFVWNLLLQLTRLRRFQVPFPDGTERQELYG
ncbi:MULTISPECIES: WecB/TagA/CpsF family glycosyltransferase [Deinococcus]|uniref:WecB/TagA/CpsF family glycosyltransferase n=1 Tax=Deinococcus TaxID=1298 RepID=UPI0018DF8328|nr:MULTISPECIES: WecB/TagA/CpsF family glycosyltransferase [Deinococcus]MBI0446292.1 glycosyltransferase [Deinococcus sp. DB0503]